MFQQDAFHRNNEELKASQCQSNMFRTGCQGTEGRKHGGHADRQLAFQKQAALPHESLLWCRARSLFAIVLCVCHAGKPRVSWQRSLSPNAGTCKESMCLLLAQHGRLLEYSLQVH